jgi:hypothetical protein
MIMAEGVASAARRGRRFFARGDWGIIVIRQKVSLTDEELALAVADQSAVRGPTRQTGPTDPQTRAAGE